MQEAQTNPLQTLQFSDSHLCRCSLELTRCTSGLCFEAHPLVATLCSTAQRRNRFEITRAMPWRERRHRTRYASSPDLAGHITWQPELPHPQSTQPLGRSTLVPADPIARIVLFQGLKRPSRVARPSVVAETPRHWLLAAPETVTTKCTNTLLSIFYLTLLPIKYQTHGIGLSWFSLTTLPASCSRFWPEAPLSLVRSWTQLHSRTLRPAFHTPWRASFPSRPTIGPGHHLTYWVLVLFLEVMSTVAPVQILHRGVPSLSRSRSPGSVGFPLLLGMLCLGVCGRL